MNHIPNIICWKLYIPDSDDFYIKEQDKFETELHNGHFDFEKIRGKTDDTKYIYFLPNITKEDSEGMSGHFQHVYSYRKNQNSHSAEERQKELDDFLTSRKLKDEFSLSLTVLSENFFKRYPEKTPEKLMAEVDVYIKGSAVHTGKERWEYRGRMYHHPESWELEDGSKNQYYENWRKNK